MVRDPNLDNNILDNDSFYLSKPLRTNFQINFNKIMSNSFNNQQQDDFTFLQPFQSERLNKNINTLKSFKAKITSTLRSQPYSLTKPTKLVNNEDKATSAVVNSNKTGSNNAILARINSMSSTLKSLFNKSRNGTKIDISNLTSKKKANDSNNNNNNSLNNSDQENQQRPDDNIKSQEGYLKKNESVNDYLLKITGTSSNNNSSTLFDDDSNYLNERIKKLSKEYDELIKTNQQQQKKYLKNYIDDSTSTASVSSVKDKLPKWTCMICLNKNRYPIDLYCSICGSAKTSSTTHSYASSNCSTIDHTFTKPSFQKSNNKSLIFGKLTTNTNTSSVSSTSSAISPPTDVTVNRSKKYSKTWRCPHCEFANDNLKIVCVNCRTPKSEAKLDIT